MTARSSDVVIIGGGPAGASAATFTARAGLSTVVVDADKGITRRAQLNNHLGFPEGIAGPALVDRGRDQAERAGATWVEGTAEAIEGATGAFTVRLADGAEVAASSVVLATGTSVALAEAAGVATAAGTEPRIATIAQVDAEGRTSVPGIWAAGTVGGVSVHTIVTAGDGARVAINLISEVRGERHVDHDVLPAG
ncbi:MAG: FAD-dependent oxidoreductase [Acidimicrobiia bacterium]